MYSSASAATFSPTSRIESFLVTVLAAHGGRGIPERHDHAHDPKRFRESGRFLEGRTGDPSDPSNPRNDLTSHVNSASHDDGNEVRAVDRDARVDHLELPPEELGARLRMRCRIISTTPGAIRTGGRSRGRPEPEPPLAPFEFAGSARSIIGLARAPA